MGIEVKNNNEKIKKIYGNFKNSIKDKKINSKEALDLVKKMPIQSLTVDRCVFKN